MYFTGILRKMTFVEGCRRTRPTSQQHVKLTFPVVISGVYGSTTFFHTFLTNGKIFEKKKKLFMKRVF